MPTYNYINLLKCKLCVILFFIFAIPSINFNLKAQSGFTSFEHLTINEGLSQGTINSIVLDKFGFLWFGTNDGLNRFDGYDFKIFRNEDSDDASIVNNSIAEIDVDNWGNIWAATAEGFSMFDYSTETFKNFTIQLPNTKDNPDINNIRAILCDKIYKKNIIWLGTSNGFLRYDVAYDIFEKFDLPDPFNQNTYVNSFGQTKNGDLWIGTSKNQILNFNRVSNRITSYSLKGTTGNVLFEPTVNNIFIDSSERVWAATKMGLYLFNASKNEFELVSYLGNHQTGDSEFFSIAESKNGKLFFGTDASLIFFDKLKNESTILKNDLNDTHSICGSAILSILVDQNDLLWLGTNGNGIDILNHFKNNFNLFSYKKGKLQIKSVRAFCEDGNGNLWIGGYYGLNKFIKNSGVFEYYFQPGDLMYSNFSSSIFSMTCDKDYPTKFIWLGTDGKGLIKFNVINGDAEQIPFLTENNFSTGGVLISALFDDRFGNLWIGHENGFDVYQKNNRKIIKYHQGLPEFSQFNIKSVNAITMDSNGKYWIGTGYGGVIIYDLATKRISNFKHNKSNPFSISSNNIKVIFEDKEKNIWIGTQGGGLNKFNKKDSTFTRITTKNGLPNDVVYGIVEDDFGNLWLSTNFGLCRYNIKNNSFRNYSVNDGLQSNEFNAKAFFKSSSGEILFGGINGYNSFYPQNIAENKFIPPIIILNFYLFNEKISVGKSYDGAVILPKSAVVTDTIFLPYDKNAFSFEFTSLDFSSTKQNKFAYMLEGFDKKWNYSGNTKIAHYTNIEPGNYIFKVKGTNSDGIWNEMGRSIVMIISPPFWATWWFKLLGIAVFGFILYGLYEFRVIAERKRNDELEREVEQRTEELKIANVLLRNDALILEEANKSKDKLFSIISHDLKNPFQSLLGYTEWLLEDYNSLNEDEKRKIINNICESSVNIYNLLVRLLEWSRLQTSKVVFEPVNIDLKGLVDNIADLLHVSLAKKQITIVNEIDYNVKVFADENMLVSVVQNLISNAIKFSFDNSVIIVSMVGNEDFVAVSVSDSGVGISENNIRRLFKTESIFSTKGTNNEQGTGFGLLLCKELVEKNGGTIWVESELGKGSAFKFTVPRENTYEKVLS